MALIDALPENLQDQLELSAEQERLGYQYAITVESLVCDTSEVTGTHDVCDLIIKL